MRFVAAVLAVAASVVAAAVSAPAARADYENFRTYWSGNAYSGEYHTTGFDSGCAPTSGSAADFTGPGYVTVALIDTSGGWRYSLRTNVRPAQVYIYPDTYSNAASWTKKALCKNSTQWQITFWMGCTYWYWVQDPVRTFCV